MIAPSARSMSSTSVPSASSASKPVTTTVWPRRLALSTVRTAASRLFGVSTTPIAVPASAPVVVVAGVVTVGSVVVFTAATVSVDIASDAVVPSTPVHSTLTASSTPSPSMADTSTVGSGSAVSAGPRTR
ncbi:hypothetical protein ACFQRB_19620 [Halobaculum litoreum]|uniref:Uncharacterized protein n=1 Tax=Halobaculum litoreum TaxID=3031998 RepID=A0ABD5XWI9_9EURY